MITGSHNPPEYNGFKMMVGEETLYGETIQQVYRLLKDGKITSDKPGSKSSCDIIPIMRIMSCRTSGSAAS